LQTLCSAVACAAAGVANPKRPRPRLRPQPHAGGRTQHDLFVTGSNALSHLLGIYTCRRENVWQFFCCRLPLRSFSRRKIPGKQAIAARPGNCADSPAAMRLRSRARITAATVSPSNQQNGVEFPAGIRIGRIVRVLGDPAQLARWVIRTKTPLHVRGRYPTQCMQFGLDEPRMPPRCSLICARISASLASARLPRRCEATRSMTPPSSSPMVDRCRGPQPIRRRSPEALLW